MMMTLRGVAMESPRPSDAGCVPGVSTRSDAEDGTELSQVPDLVVRPCDAVGQRLPRTIHPRDGHAQPLGAHDVDVRAIADEQRVGRRHADARERLLEDPATRLAPSDLVGHPD